MKKKIKEEYRYQFLRFETVGTGKYVVPKRKKIEDTSFGIGSVLAGLTPAPYEIEEEVAVVFDKNTGKVKQTKIDKMFKQNHRKYLKK